MAFDTIYAEGQRRYVESLSTYARQFLGVMDKPDVDSIDGLSPAISIDQKGASHNPRSTVGTITEIYDYLRLLFARIGHPHCPSCGREISQQGVQQIVDQVLRLCQQILETKRQARLMILSPVVRDRKGEFKELFENLRTKGYQKIRVDKQIFNLAEELVLIKTNKHTIEAVIDRLTMEKSLLRNKISLASFKNRLADDVEQALKLSDGLVVVSEVQDSAFQFPEKPKKFCDHLFSEYFACPVCNISLPPVEPRTFSFNSPYGACPTCGGIGLLLKIDKELVLNPNLSITEGGILPFGKAFAHDTWFARIIKTVCQKYRIDIRAPLLRLTKAQRQILLYGTGEEIHQVEGENRFGRLTHIWEDFPGIIVELERRYEETESEFIRAEIEKYMRREICPACGGGRLKKEALGITITGKSIVEITRLAIADAYTWGTNLPNLISERELAIANLILKEIKARLSFLIAVGLDYLTLDRAAQTLAGGETQRIRLASQIGSGLSGVLYVLDEPSIGLHQRDNKRLIDTLKNLRDLGNTVIVVEHDREMIESADWILDFGPGAGDHGGQIVAQGTVEKIKRNRQSLTGDYLARRRVINVTNPPASGQNTTNDQILQIKGCQQFNLKNINVSFPVGKFICIAGVSGSGKSTLIVETLYHALMEQLYPYHKEKPGKFESLKGLELINKVILIDQSPIGRTPRSNPATYTGAFTFIRDLFGKTHEARVRGYKPGRFSFNVKGGRCEACEGEGQIKIEMQFLPDVYVPCEVCQGKRYEAATLEVTFKGKNIAEVLQMSVEEALNFFSNIPGLVDKLKTLNDVGLSYIHLGQPAPTLSGGEAQRVKLAAELSKRATGKTLYILDEPTTGLHFADLEKLLMVLRRLVQMGNTVIIIEHNLDVIKNADFIIDLGPEGGDKGGYIVAQGTPKEVSLIKKSYTGQFLARIL
ncbi:MAG: excinuclease ABC subunit A [Microgenomates group bacterium LiPW_16]|nr:MAG: excinuclease ABC subunit A [Microgenomates group bacterium LiPW_16]